MATAMKCWYVNVLKWTGPTTVRQIESRQAVSASSATEKLKEAKEKYVNVPGDPSSTDPAIKYGIKYDFVREQY
jgi:hypothetical protein